MSSSFSRRAFLEGAAATVGAVLVSGCGPSATPQPVAKAQDATFVLTGTQIPKAGEAISFAFPNGEQGLLYHAKTGETGAVSAVCTHQGCIVQWEASNAQTPIICRCHQSKFDLNGRVLGGPAKAPLAHFRAEQNGSDVELKKA